ncbi:DUF3618 domain-containing protein [Mycolicibacterium sp. XJ1819]
MTRPEQARPEPGRDAGIDDIQTDIEQTREDLGHTVQALGAKLDVKAQARHKAASVRHSAADNPQVPVIAAVAVLTVLGLLLWRRRH